MIRGSTSTPTSIREGSGLGLASACAERIENGLLAALPAALSRWVSRLEPVVFTSGEVLWETDSPLTHVYFPTTAIISLFYEMKNGFCAEVGVVGSEGMAGVAVVMGSELTWSRAVVQSAGEGFRLDADVIKVEFARIGSVVNLLLRYIQALITQITQTAACNRLHRLDQQLCRRLLASLDRSSSDELTMTHDLIASSLGVRREGVTQAAIKLQRAGIIHYSRGHITVLDRAGLEAASCECYSVIKREYNRLLPAARRVRPDTHAGGFR
jgi:CRP-like cAMP-binding protein